MKKESLKIIKNMLTIQRDEISKKQIEPVDIDISGDEVDRIQGKILANIQEQLSSRDKLKLKSIDVALNKISEDSYGVCEECGEEIAEKRLMFNPIFINCVNCSELLEVEKRRNKRST